MSGGRSQHQKGHEVCGQGRSTGGVIAGQPVNTLLRGRLQLHGGPRLAGGEIRVHLKVCKTSQDTTFRQLPGTKPSSQNRYKEIFYFPLLLITLSHFNLERAKNRIVNGRKEEDELRGIRKIQNVFPYPVVSLTAQSGLRQGRGREYNLEMYMKQKVWLGLDE